MCSNVVKALNHCFVLTAWGVVSLYNAGGNRSYSGYIHQTRLLNAGPTWHGPDLSSQVSRTDNQSWHRPVTSNDDTVSTSWTLTVDVSTCHSDVVHTSVTWGTPVITRNRHNLPTIAADNISTLSYFETTLYEHVFDETYNPWQI